MILRTASWTGKNLRNWWLVEMAMWFPWMELDDDLPPGSVLYFCTCILCWNNDSRYKSITYLIFLLFGVNMFFFSAVKNKVLLGGLGFSKTLDPLDPTHPPPWLDTSAVIFASWIASSKGRRCYCEGHPSHGVGQKDTRTCLRSIECSGYIEIILACHRRCTRQLWDTNPMSELAILSYKQSIHTSICLCFAGH